jgi:dimethylhistidine N-methyltransferase
VSPLQHTQPSGHHRRVRRSGEDSDPGGRSAIAPNPLHPLRLHDLEPKIADVCEEVRVSLSQQPRRLSPKFFYDERGSRLFEAITRQPEYYPTRAEIEILAREVDQICDLVGKGALLVEYGSGSSRKSRLLIEALRPRVYKPIDISRDQLLSASRRLVRDFAWLQVEAVCADYSQSLVLPWHPSEHGVLGFFPGSSIGNLEPREAGRFLSHVRSTLGRRGVLIVGVDRRKSKARLEAAYNDEAGFTADFNRNVLAHLKTVLGGDVVPYAFDHRAFCDHALGRFEMHLVSRHDQRFQLGDQIIQMRAGESIQTECSYKYTPDEFRALARASGFDVLRSWTDAEELFSVFALRVV